jgi:carbonic anhydrase/acetyltransferase-like protein (isoleucine patch superfamily)
LAHLEGCIVEDNALIGSNSVVLHNAIIRTGALVGAGAVVSGGVEVPSGAMALGVPATIKLDRVVADHIRINADVYVERGRQYRQQLRRLD